MELTLETFLPHVRSTFTLRAGEATLPLELVEATALPAGRAGGRPPFALEFDGPADPVHPQAIVELTHDVLGSLAIFVVPIGRDERHTRYEAIFN
jgi:hypothetical protein